MQSRVGVIHGDEVAQNGGVERSEIGRGYRSGILIRRTEKNFWYGEFIRQDLKMAPFIWAGRELHSAAVGLRNFHREFLAVVAGPRVKGNGSLLEIVDALNAKRAGFVISIRLQY